VFSIENAIYQSEVNSNLLIQVNETTSQSAFNTLNAMEYKMWRITQISKEFL